MLNNKKATFMETKTTTFITDGVKGELRRAAATADILQGAFVNDGTFMASKLKKENAKVVPLNNMFDDAVKTESTEEKNEVKFETTETAAASRVGEMFSASERFKDGIVFKTLKELCKSYGADLTAHGNIVKDKKSVATITPFDVVKVNVYGVEKLVMKVKINGGNTDMLIGGQVEDKATGRILNVLEVLTLLVIQKLKGNYNFYNLTPFNDFKKEGLETQMFIFGGTVGELKVKSEHEKAIAFCSKTVVEDVTAEKMNIVLPEISVSATTVGGNYRGMQILNEMPKTELEKMKNAGAVAMSPTTLLKFSRIGVRNGLPNNSNGIIKEFIKLADGSMMNVSTNEKMLVVLFKNEFEHYNLGLDMFAANLKTVDYLMNKADKLAFEAYNVTAKERVIKAAVAKTKAEMVQVDNKLATEQDKNAKKLLKLSNGHFMFMNKVVKKELVLAKAMEEKYIASNGGDIIWDGKETFQNINLNTGKGLTKFVLEGGEEVFGLLCPVSTFAGGKNNAQQQGKDKAAHARYLEAVYAL